MNFSEYSLYFKSILDKGISDNDAPYTDENYFLYTQLNWSRMNRWLKTAHISEEILETVSKIDEPLSWLIITEPWCGDAAHSVPFIELIARNNPLITVSYELRDSSPFTINSYLTNGGKSIPKLIIRDAEDNDLATWGPRPKDCQAIYDGLIKENAPFEKIKIELQNWYNANKGKDLQFELNALLNF